MKLSLILFFYSVFAFGNSQYHQCPDGEFVQHQYFKLCYSEIHEQAYWVAHDLTPENISGTQSRTNNFRSDPKVSTESAGASDYRGSGFDRGHLVPAGDMKQNYISMSETFFMSNMSPQDPGFNRGIWRVLEEKIRTWVGQDRIVVVTGPILYQGLPQMNSISIPDAYFKLLFNVSKNKMIAFVLPNKKSQADLRNFATSVDEVERLTGINFFARLPREAQDSLEQMQDYETWDSGSKI